MKRSRRFLAKDYIKNQHIAELPIIAKLRTTMQKAAQKTARLAMVGRKAYR